MSRHFVTRREFDTILAALRLSMHDSAWIADGDGMIRAIAEEHGGALTNEEIDALCQKLNLDGEPNQPHLSAEDWVEIYYAVQEKLTNSPSVAGSDAEAVSWRKHLRAILRTIGPDGENMFDAHPNTDQHRAACASCMMAHDKALPDA